jgi:hypothetical protein
VPPTTWSRQTQVGEIIGGEQFDPPPADVMPGHTYLEAWASNVKYGMCLPETPEMRLALFTDAGYGRMQPDGSEIHPYQNILVWVLIWRDQACIDTGPPPSPSPRPTSICDYVTPIDASSNAVLLTSSA